MTTDKITLCDFPAKTQLEGWESFSPFVLQASRALKLAKLPFEHVHVNMFKLKELNPTGQLPVVIFGEEKVADTKQIIARIEALAPGVFAQGVDASAAAEAWLWKEFADTALYPFVLATRWIDERGWPVPKQAFFGDMPAPLRLFVPGIVRNGMRKKLIERDYTRRSLDDCYARLARVLDSLDARAPEAGFWLGAQPTTADLGLFSHLHALRMPSIAFQAAEVARRVRLTRYLDRVDAATR